jgi:hypothetical protein
METAKLPPVVIASIEFRKTDKTVDKLAAEMKPFSTAEYGFISGAEWQRQQDEALIKSISAGIESLITELQSDILRLKEAINKINYV